MHLSKKIESVLATYTKQLHIIKQEALSLYTKMKAEETEKELQQIRAKLSSPQPDERAK